jgi:non-heme chloroperoxidase
LAGCHSDDQTSGVDYWRKGKHLPWQSQEWIQRQVSGSQLEIFEEEEGGNHFMFLENPEKFNSIVSAFIG